MGFFVTLTLPFGEKNGRSTDGNKGRQETGCHRVCASSHAWEKNDKSGLVEADEKGTTQAGTLARSSYSPAQVGPKNIFILFLPLPPPCIDFFGSPLLANGGTSPPPPPPRMTSNRWRRRRGWKGSLGLPACLFPKRHKTWTDASRFPFDVTN